jgi:hypothetical protein
MVFTRLMMSSKSLRLPLFTRPFGSGIMRA